MIKQLSLDLLIDTIMRLSAIPSLPPDIVASLDSQGIKTGTDLFSLAEIDIIRKLPYGQCTLGQISLHRTIVSSTSSAVGLSARSLLNSVSTNSPTNKTRLYSLESLRPVLPSLVPYTGRVLEVSGHIGSVESVNYKAV